MPGYAAHAARCARPSWPRLHLSFVRDNYTMEGRRYSSFQALPGATFARASVGTAEDLAGNVISFTSGPPRLVVGRGQLIEEARTNAVPISFSGTAAALWPTLASATVALGSLTPRLAGASTVLITTTGTNGRAQRNVTVPVDTVTRTFSVDVQRKANSYNVSIGYSGGATVSTALVFDGLTGVVSSGTGKVVAKNADWWRVEVSCANNGTAGSTVLYGFVQVTGGSGLTAEVSIHQIEDGSFATSYIPTTSGAVTRAIDNPLLTGIAALLTPPFTMIASAELLAIDGVTRRLVTLHDGTSNNLRILSRGSGNQAAADVTSAGVLQSVPLAPNKIGARMIRLAARYRAGSIRPGPDGALLAETAITDPGALDRLGLGISQTGGSSPLNGYLRSLTILGDVSDAALQQITTAAQPLDLDFTG